MNIWNLFLDLFGLDAAVEHGPAEIHIKAVEGSSYARDRNKLQILLFHS